MHYRTIHTLRGFAALLVVVFHSFFSVEWMRPLVGHVGWTRFGVDIFFVISGFVMIESAGDGQTSPARFLVRRLVRVAPLYWLVTIFVVAATRTWSAGQIAASVLFIPYEDPQSGLFQPLLAPGWTLNLEMLFYVLFASAMTFSGRLRVPAITAALSLLCISHVIWPNIKILGLYGDTLVLNFALGMAIARYRVRLHWSFALVGLLLLMVSETITAPPIVAQGLPSGMIIAGVLSLEGRLRDNAIGRLAGDASYAIYLAHLPVIAVVGHALSGHIEPGIRAAVILVASGTAAGLLVHVVVERPMMRDIRRLLRRIEQGHHVRFEMASQRS